MVIREVLVTHVTIRNGSSMPVGKTGDVRVEFRVVLIENP
jgi:hypothetical protein